MSRNACRHRVTSDDCRDPSCSEHPHCVCGARLDDDGSRELVCECGGRVLIGTAERERAEAAR